MNKIVLITAIFAVVSVFAFAGCQKSNAPAPKSAEQSSGTVTVPAKPAMGC